MPSWTVTINELNQRVPAGLPLASGEIFASDEQTALAGALETARMYGTVALVQTDLDMVFVLVDTPPHN